MMSVDAKLGATMERTATTRAIWDDFSRRLRGFIAKRVANPADVDDLVQSVYLRIHQHLDSLREEGHVEAWLYRIARNAIADYYRSRGASELPSIDVEPAAAEEPVDATRAEIARCLMPMVDELTKTDREIVRLTDVQGLTMTEAAKRLKLSVPGAKSRAQRARARLRKMFIDCCRVDFDARGRAVDLEKRKKPCC